MVASALVARIPADIRVFGLFPGCFRDKLLFLVPVALYWVLPDFMPFLPIDDIGVTMLLMNWFVSRVERKYPGLLGENQGTVKRAR